MRETAPAQKAGRGSPARRPDCRGGLFGLIIRLAAAPLALALMAPAAQAENRPPYEIVRSMEALQDQIALGNKAALNALPEISAQLAEKLLTQPPAVWREPRNSRAAVIYVLSGGQARVLHKILANFDGPADERKLMEGALAYVGGQEAKAKRLFADVDPRSLDSLVGAHVAVAEAALLVHEDPHRALDLLDTARILAPGTLVEEAALRREVFLSQQIGDFDKFVTVTGQYLRRFSRSSYAENFLNRFSASLNAIAVAGRLDQVTRLEPILDEMGENGRLRLYLAIAQSALVNGKLDTAQYASAKAAALARQGSVEARRAGLYAGAVEILLHPGESGPGTLDAIEIAKLSRGDADLAHGAMALAEEIHHWPEARTSLRDRESATMKPPAGSEQAMATADSTIDVAEKALAGADELMKGQRR